MLRFTLCFALFAALPAFAAEPDLSSPPAALRSYLAATKANDIETAKKCWTIDDDNASGALDVIAGMWISSRELVAITKKKFGREGVKLLGRWNRPACSDDAIDLTTERIGDPKLNAKEYHAWFSIGWQAGDGDMIPAFLHPAKIIVCRKVGNEWRIDANIFTDRDQAQKLFIPGQSWPVWRDEMEVMNGLTKDIQNGTISTPAEFERELKSRVDALKAKYAKR